MLTADAIANRNFHFAKRSLCFAYMEALPTRNRRLEKLRAEVKSAGGPTGFVSKYGLSRDPSYFSQVLNGHRGFGEQAARKLEADCGWPHEYLDREEPANDDIFMMVREFPLELRTSLEAHIRQLYESLKAPPPKK